MSVVISAFSSAEAVLGPMPVRSVRVMRSVYQPACAGRRVSISVLGEEGKNGGGDESEGSYR